MYTEKARTTQHTRFPRVLEEIKNDHNAQPSYFPSTPTNKHPRLFTTVDISPSLSQYQQQHPNLHGQSSTTPIPNRLWCTPPPRMNRQGPSVLRTAVPSVLSFPPSPTAIPRHLYSQNRCSLLFGTPDSPTIPPTLLPASILTTYLSLTMYPLMSGMPIETLRQWDIISLRVHF